MACFCWLLYTLLLLCPRICYTQLNFDYIDYLKELKSWPILNGGDGLFVEKESLPNSSRVIYFHRIPPKFSIVLPCCLPNDCYDEFDYITWRNTFGLSLYHDTYVSQTQDRFGNILIRDPTYRNLKIICEMTINENTTATFEHAIRYFQLSLPNYMVNFSLSVLQPGEPAAGLPFTCFDSRVMALIKMAFYNLLKEKCKHIKFCLGPSIEAVYCDQLKPNVTLPVYILEATFYMDWRKYYRELPFQFVKIRRKLFLEVCEYKCSFN